MKHPKSIIVLIPFLVLLGGLAWSPVSTNVFVGTYRIDPSSAFGGGSPLPTNFLAMTLTFKAGGTFVASNVPAGGLRVGVPATLEAHGTWTLKPNSRDEATYLFMDLTQPTNGFVGSTPVHYGGYSPFHYSPRIYWCHDCGHGKDLVFYWIKQE